MTVRNSRCRFSTPVTAQALWLAPAWREIAPADPGGWPGANGGVQFRVHPDSGGSAATSWHRKLAMGRRRYGAARVQPRVRALQAASRRETTRGAARARTPAPKRRAMRSGVPNPESPPLRLPARTPLGRGGVTERTTTRWRWHGRAASNGLRQAARAEPARSRSPVQRAPTVSGAPSPAPRGGMPGWRSGRLGSNGAGSSARAMSRHSGARKSRRRGPSRMATAGTHSRSIRSSSSSPCADPSGTGASSAEINFEAWNRYPWSRSMLTSRSSAWRAESDRIPVYGCDTLVRESTSWRSHSDRIAVALRPELVCLHTPCGV